MKVFLDTNILIDFLTNRPPFSSEALEIFALSEEGKIQLFTSTHSIAATHYILKKQVSENHLRHLLSEISEIVTVLDITQTIARTSLKSAHRDFEDAIQIGCAESKSDIDYIVSRNLKDFKTSSIPAISVQELLTKIDLS
ncbi:type II toxin-antitoxin system VapC family toxin [Algoriphagus aquimarinus]|uniref:Predicted nucleic acid-binding protein, contains PIN domain n=1 Tax=Algoriphagus aquimarinus TaxID=237018 RepID=A0A1I0WMC8_9BACT|nr:PIN domain-containing protein [Algoriphagus aquimarinus]SFA89320.1 Predicted nucleic acid-binding protein, contains PIN domain [Algoriphagus aquimarinus]